MTYCLREARIARIRDPETSHRRQIQTFTPSAPMHIYAVWQLSTLPLDRSRDGMSCVSGGHVRLGSYARAAGLATVATAALTAIAMATASESQ